MQAKEDSLAAVIILSEENRRQSFIDVFPIVHSAMG